jgi:tetratricopeptide (TPR) repeat protein
MKGAARFGLVAALVQALALASVTCSLVGCARTPPAPACDEADAGAPVDPALLAFLSRARAAHHRADVPEERGDLEQAIAELDALLAGPLPKGPKAPEVREVLADTHARLADLRSRAGDFERAEDDVAKGLELVPGPSYFRGHLIEVRGLSEERRSKALAAAGNMEKAEQAKQRALAAFQEAMDIQARVIEEKSPR